MKSIPPNDVQEEALQPKSQLRSASDIIFSNLNGLCGIWTFQKTPCYLPSTPSTPSTPSLLPFLPVCPFVFPFSSLPLSPFFFNFSLHSFCQFSRLRLFLPFLPPSLPIRSFFPSYISFLLPSSTSSFSFPPLLLLSFLPPSLPHSLLPSFTPFLPPYLHPLVHSPSLLQEVLYCTVFSCQVSFSQNANSFLPLILPYVNFIKSLLSASCVPYSLCPSLFRLLYIFIFFIFFSEGYFRIFKVLSSALFHLQPFRFHCAGGCWDRTQDSCDFIFLLSSLPPPSSLLSYINPKLSQNIYTSLFVVVYLCTFSSYCSRTTFLLAFSTPSSSSLV